MRFRFWSFTSFSLHPTGSNDGDDDAYSEGEGGDFTGHLRAEDETVTGLESVIPLVSIGSSYEGEWKHNRMHGFGRYTFSNGNYYVGYFIDGQ